MNYEEAQQILEGMNELEAMALRRCASYQMDQEDLEEIGSSDISCRAIDFIKSSGWPTDFGDVGIGFLVDEYQKDVQNNPCVEPASTLDRIQASEAHRSSLPDWAYEGKHMLSMEAYNQFKGMQGLFA